MFIEKIYQDNPILVEKTVKNILNLNPEFDKFIRDELKPNTLTYIVSKRGYQPYNITLKDFYITQNFYSKHNIEWILFMTQIFGMEYITAFQDFREKSRNKIKTLTLKSRHGYNFKKYDAETKSIVDLMKQHIKESLERDLP